MNEADAGQSPTGSKDGIIHALRGWTKLIALISFILCLLIAFTPKYSVKYIPESFDSVGGFGWVAPAPIYGDDSENRKVSNLIVYDSGEALGPAHSPHNEIRELGGGRFSHWADLVYFSTRDGTNPT